MTVFRGPKKGRKKGPKKGPKMTIFRDPNKTKNRPKNDPKRHPKKGSKNGHFSIFWVFCHGPQKPRKSVENDVFFPYQIPIYSTLSPLIVFSKYIIVYTPHLEISRFSITFIYPPKRVQNGTQKGGLKMGYFWGIKKGSKKGSKMGPKKGGIFNP